MIIRDKYIMDFLSGLSDLEYRYIRLQMSMANDARNLIQEFNLEREEFCKLMNINEVEYESYLNGGFEYDLKKMAMLNAVYCQLKAEQASIEVKTKFVQPNIKT